MKSTDDFLVVYWASSVEKLSMEDLMKKDKILVSENNRFKNPHLKIVKAVFGKFDRQKWKTMLCVLTSPPHGTWENVFNDIFARVRKQMAWKKYEFNHPNMSVLIFFLKITVSFSGYHRNINTGDFSMAQPSST